MSEPTFEIEFEPQTLFISEIWPDGDAPANPTAEDVAAKMRKERDVLTSWNLTPTSLTVDRISLDGPRDTVEVRL